MLRVFAAFSGTLLLTVLLVFTIFFTALEWQWTAFLSGILFAAVLSLVSVSVKSAQRIAQRAADAVHYKDLYAVEREQHRHAQASLERETAQRLQESERLSRSTEALRTTADRAHAASSLLDALERELQEIVFLVDREMCFRFHTRGFASWVHAQPVRIQNHPLDEVLSAQRLAEMTAPIADALQGQAGRIELDGGNAETAGNRFLATFTPHYGLRREIAGVLVRLAQIVPEAAAAPEEAASPAEGGDATYVASLTEDLTGWGDAKAKLREAIEHDEFDLYVQDIVALRGGTTPVRMQEVLIRMRDEERDLIPPGAFLPIAEHCGLMAEIDRYVVRKALAVSQSVPRLAPGASPLLCINLSRATLQDPSFAEFVARSLDRVGAAAQSLCFEFEDSDVSMALADTARQAHALRKLGCHCSLDGFGAAHVALDHLKQVPIDYLKIDGRIIFEIARDPVAMAKIKAIQRVCRIIGVRTIAEQVETEAALTALRQVEVDYAQGFGIAAPERFANEAQAPH